MTLHHHRLKKKMVTQTFSCERPLSALFLLTDSPPGNVSLLAKKTNPVNQKISASTFLEDYKTITTQADSGNSTSSFIVPFPQLNENHRDP